jgi:hypothetical protein
VDPRGASDWQDLAVLVRLPVLTTLTCPTPPEGPCQLSGANLFLLQAVSSRPSFDDAVNVPEGFTGDAVQIPRPRDGRLYLRLRDDESVVAVAPVTSRRHMRAVPGS